MGGSGMINYMRWLLKHNQRPRKKGFEGFATTTRRNTPMRTVSFTDRDRARIRKKMRAQNRRNTLKTVTVFALVAVFIAVLAIWLQNYLSQYSDVIGML